MGVLLGDDLFFDHLYLGGTSRLTGVIPLEFKVGLQRGVHGLKATMTPLRFADDFDSVATEQGDENVNGVRIDVAIRKTGVDLFVADPAAFAAAVNEVLEYRMWFKFERAQ
jgi:hypothetical protein